MLFRLLWRVRFYVILGVVLFVDGERIKTVDIFEEMGQ